MEWIQKIKKSKNKLTNLIRKQKFLFYRQKFNDYKNPKDVWKEVKNLTKTGKVQEVSICQIFSLPV